MIIDTHSANYKRHLANLRAIRAYLKPAVDARSRMSFEAREKWDEHDPLISELIGMGDRVTRGKSDDHS